MVQKMKYQDLLCSSRKYFHTLPNKRDFFQDPTPFQILLELLYHKFLQIFRSKKTLQPQKIPLFSVGSLDIFQNCTLLQKVHACLLTKEANGLFISIPADFLASSTISFTLRRHSSSPMSCEIEINNCEYIYLAVKKTHYQGSGLGLWFGSNF